MASTGKKTSSGAPSGKAPWKKPNPKPAAARKPLSAAAKARARARAREAGRRYPNLIDNMWAARQVKS